MARRRSLNRRSSRKSLNVTELDENSELVDTRDTLWWKHLEGDTTVHRSRPSLYGETTEPILNDDSAVSTSELKNEWWKSLDKTATTSLHRNSTRKSVQVTETPSESFNSEGSDYSGVKKRKVVFRARDKKDTRTENFLAVLKNSNLPSDGNEKSKSRSEETLTNSHQRNRRSQGKNVGESEAETSVNTSNDTDVVLKWRPKPFKKRFTKMSDGIFDNAESAQASKSPTLQHSSEQQSVYKTVHNSSQVEKSPTKLSNVGDLQLMGPPKISSHRKRLSSVSRKLEISSEESESDGGPTKKRFVYRKKSRKGVSINPFYESIRANLESQEIEQEELETGNKESSLHDSKMINSGNENFTPTNHSSTFGVKEKFANRSKAHQSFMREISPSQQIDDASNNDDENLIEKQGESGETLEKGADRSLRSVRSAKRLIDDSAYELPLAERSTTPINSDAEKEGEKPFSAESKSGRTSRMSLRSNRSAIQNPRGSVEPPNLSKSKTSAARKTRGNYSRTRIFSDEDISVEDISYSGRNENSMQHDQHEVRKSRKSFAAKKSQGIIQPGKNTVENEVPEDSIPKSIDLRPEDLHRSSESRTRSITRIIFSNKIQQQRKIDGSFDGAEPGIVDQSISSNLRKLEKITGNQSRTSNSYEKIVEPEEIGDEEITEDVENSENLQAEENTYKSRNSVVNKSQTITQNKRPFEPEKSEDEEDIAQETETSRLPDKSNNSKRKFTKKSQETFEIQEETNDESEVTDESISMSLRSTENPRRSRKSVANKSQTSNRNRRLSELEEGEDEQDIAQETKTSRLPDKSNNSRGKITNKSQENFESQEETNDEPEVVDESISLRLRSKENPRPLRQNVANKSGTNNQKEGTFEREESEDDEEVSQQMENSRLHERSTNSSEKVTNESQASVETSDDEESHLETNDSKSSRSQSKKNLQKLRKSLAPLNISRHNTESLESVHEDEPQVADKTDTRSSSSQLREKSRKSAMSFATRKRSFSDENSSADENAKEIHQESRKSGVNKKSVTFGKNISRNKSRIIDSDASTSEEEDAKKSDGNSRISQLRKKLHESKNSLETIKSQKRVLSDKNDSGDESEVVQEQNSESLYSTSMLRRQYYVRNIEINQSQKNTQSDESASEDEEENMKKSDSNLHKSRASGKSFPLDGSQKSIQTLEKIVENEAESSKELATTSKPKSLARPNTSQRNFDSDEIVDENNEQNEDHRGPLTGKKSMNNPGSSKDVLVTPKTKNTRESSFMKKQNVKDVSRLNSSSFTPLAANIPRTNHSTPLHPQKTITKFFPSIFLQKSNNTGTREVSSSFDREKFKKVKEKLEEMKKRELKSMKLEAEAKKKEDDLKKRLTDSAKQKKKSTETAAKKSKVVDKAFIVNGAVYKPPRLPRPKPWVTDRLYHHLWKLMEPKYRISTRIKSEEFIKNLAKAVVFITKRAKYETYKHELDALMKNMAHLGIIKTRNDFYDFCYDFLPYDFRVKVTPIMMPGNILTIPYDPAKLHTPLIRED